MKAPIIVSERGDLAIFQTPEHAELYLEPVDVRNGEYVAYDGDGRILKLTVVESEESSALGFGKKGIDRVKLEDVEVEADHFGNLREVLANFFKRTGNEIPEASSAPLGKLIEEAVRRYGYTR